MALVKTKQGYEVKVYADATPNTAATTLWWQVTDVDIEIGIEEGPQTSRGDGSAPPEKYTAVTGRSRQATVKILNGSADDPVLVAILARITAGLAWALKITNAAGGIIFDADVICDAKAANPLNAEGTYEFVCRPTLAGSSPRAGTFHSVG